MANTSGTIFAEHVETPTINMIDSVQKISFLSSITSMKLLRGVLIVLATALPVAFVVAQGSTATQSLTLEVKPVTKLAVSGNPGSMTISDALAGSAQMTVQDNSTTYHLTTNLENMKIVASIDNPMPPGTRLMLNLGSTAGVSEGLVDISNATFPLNVVTGIGKGTESGQSIAYVFAADAEIGEVPSQSRTITLTLTN